jgi:hypothetical protein
MTIVRFDNFHRNCVARARTHARVHARAHTHSHRILQVPRVIFETVSIEVPFRDIQVPVRQVTLTLNSSIFIAIIS